MTDMHHKLIAPVVLGMILATPAAARRDSDAARIADAILAAQIRISGVPGMAATVTRDGRILWEGAAGKRDRARNLPVTPRTSFRFASVSKLLTATAAMRLVQSGTLDLDRPVQVLVPGLDPSWPAITARQLAAHTSGMPHYQERDDSLGRTHFATVTDALRNLQDRPLLAAPGTAYRYSSWGYTLLSAVVEAAAGQPFADHVAQHITPGLAIGPGDGPSDDEAAIGHEFADGDARPAPAHDYSYSLGGAAFRGTATGLARFGDRVMDDHFLSAATRRAMWSPSQLNSGTPVSDRDYEVAVGWRIGRDRSGDMIAHHAGTMPEARSTLVLHPDDRMATALLANAGWVSAIEQTALMLAAPFRVKADPAAPPCPIGARRYRGVFGAQPIAGEARFRLIGGHCRGSITVANAAGDWFNSFPQDDSGTISILAVTADGRLGRAALVTPTGSYDLRVGREGSYSARLGTNRELSVRFSR